MQSFLGQPLTINQDMITNPTNLSKFKNLSNLKGHKKLLNLEGVNFLGIIGELQSACSDLFSSLSFTSSLGYFT
jgi:hypothetical protein